jgi:fatty-acyl-CoA synthase
MRKVIDVMGCRGITIAYGQTETSPVLTQSSLTDPIEVRVQTVGRALPGVEIRIADPASGKDLPDGERGELWARGHGTMLGSDSPSAQPKGWRTQYHSHSKHRSLAPICR